MWCLQSWCDVMLTVVKGLQKLQTVICFCQKLLKIFCLIFSTFLDVCCRWLSVWPGDSLVVTDCVTSRVIFGEMAEQGLLNLMLLTPCLFFQLVYHPTCALCVTHFMKYTNCYSGPGRVVSIATAYGLNGPGIEFRWGRDFPHLSRPALRST
jgi:hypothetical protein